MKKSLRMEMFGDYKTFEMKEKKFIRASTVFNIIMAVIVVLAFLFAMHGDQVALSNGYIH